MELSFGFTSFLIDITFISMFWEHFQMSFYDWNEFVVSIKKCIATPRSYFPQKLSVDYHLR